MSGALFAVGGFRAPFQLFVGVPVVWYGVLFGIGRLGASILLWYSGSLQDKLSMHAFFRTQLVLYGALFMLLGMSTTGWSS